jgi:hypothetical protein
MFDRVDARRSSRNDGLSFVSRHAKIDTLLLYDDAGRDKQGEITDLLAAGL